MVPRPRLGRPLGRIVEFEDFEQCDWLGLALDDNDIDGPDVVRFGIGETIVSVLRDQDADAIDLGQAFDSRGEIRGGPGNLDSRLSGVSA